MTYIKEYSTAFPSYRISDKVLHPRLGRKAQHAVCYVDEDIITLAYSAAQNLDKEVDGVIFATTSPVFKDRYHASYLADLLGLKEGILAIDLDTTVRAGTDAFLLADTYIKSGKYKTILVVASDAYYPAIGKETKAAFGHGAVAIILSAHGGVAKVLDTNSFSSATSEEFKYKRERTQYDPRFARTEGFKKNMGIALKESNVNPSNVDHIVLHSPYAKLAFGQLKKYGFDLEKQLMKDSVALEAGNTGVCHGLLLMLKALQNGSGNFVVFDYLNGTNIISIEAEKGKEFDEVGTKVWTDIEHYQDYLQLRKRGKFEGKGYETIEIFSSEMIQEREKENLIYLKANKCTNCGTVYYLNASRCNECHHTEFKQVQLSKTGTVYSATSEYYFPSSFPPTNMVVIDLDEGGRITVQQTDDMFSDESNTIEIGNKVQLVFRKMMENDKKPNYYWKCVKL
jgi:hydroxymethylglutaryl-CoA synthase